MVVTEYITGGYLWIYDSGQTAVMKVKCVRIGYWLNIDPTIKHYGNEGHMFYDMAKRYWNIMAEGIWIESYQDWEDFQQYLLTWHDAGPMVVEVYRTDSDKVRFWVSGAFTDHLHMAIAKGGLKKGGKESVGSVEYYKIDSILLEQAG